MIATTTNFASETQAIDYLTHRFTDDGPTQIRSYVAALQADMADEDGDWWKDITGDDLAEWLFRIIK